MRLGRVPFTLQGHPSYRSKQLPLGATRCPKQKHRVTNWAEYDVGLRARSNLIVWQTRNTGTKVGTVACQPLCHTAGY